MKKFEQAIFILRRRQKMLQTYIKIQEKNAGRIESWFRDSLLAEINELKQAINVLKKY